MAKSKKRDLIIVGGVTGTGKTFFTNNLLLEYPRVIILSPIEDEDEEYHGILFDRLDDLIAHIEEKHENKIREWRVKISDVSAFNDLCAFAYDLGYDTGGLMFCIEEAQRVIPARSPLPPSFADLLYRGRHPQVSLAIVAQRFSTVSIEARSQWRRIVSFRQTEPADVSWIVNSTGHPEAGSIPAFADREYLDISLHSSHHFIPSPSKK